MRLCVVFRPCVIPILWWSAVLPLQGIFVRLNRSSSYPVKSSLAIGFCPTFLKQDEIWRWGCWSAVQAWEQNPYTLRSPRNFYRDKSSPWLTLYLKRYAAPMRRNAYSLFIRTRCCASPAIAHSRFEQSFPAPLCSIFRCSLIAYVVLYRPSSSSIFQDEPFRGGKKFIVEPGSVAHRIISSFFPLPKYRQNTSKNGDFFSPLLESSWIYGMSDLLSISDSFWNHEMIDSARFEHNLSICQFLDSHLFKHTKHGISDGFR